MIKKNFELFRGPLKGYATSGETGAVLPPSAQAPESANLPPAPNFQMAATSTLPITLKMFYLRITALAFLYLAISQWLALLGYGESTAQNYLDFSVADRIYLVSFAILYPIIGVGVWTMLAWGRVMWYLGCIFHFIFYFFLSPSLFNFGEVAFHFGSVTIYLLSIAIVFSWGKNIVNR